MARNIKDGAPNVVDINSAKKTRKRAPKAAAGAPDAAPEAAPDAGSPIEERAPAFGHNQPTAADVRSWAHQCIAMDGRIDEAKLVVKDLRGQKRDMRANANGAGIILRELDEAISELKTEEVDLLERQERLNFYRAALGLPVFDAGAGKAKPKTSAEDEAAAWRKKGAQAGLLGKPRDLPDGIPPERIQDYLIGWDEEQENIMRKSPLTAAAFKPKPEPGGGKPAAPETAAPKTENGFLVFREHHFAAGTALNDANLRTLLDEHRASVDGVDRVVAIFGAKRRVIKEPDAECEGGFYVDDGVQAPVSDEEPAGVPAEELA